MKPGIQSVVKKISMKSNFKFYCCLLTTFLFIISCSKQEIHPIDRPVFLPSPFELKMEYVWAQPWQKTSTGQQMAIQSLRLTDSAIRKGITVSVAFESEMSVFEKLPTIINYPWLSDTVDLSYTIVPGKLTILAKTSFDIAWPSDVMIYYQ